MQASHRSDVAMAVQCRKSRSSNPFRKYCEQQLTSSLDGISRLSNANGEDYDGNRWMHTPLGRKQLRDFGNCNPRVRKVLQQRSRYGVIDRSTPNWKSIARIGHNAEIDRIVLRNLAFQNIKRNDCRSHTYLQIVDEWRVLSATDDQYLRCCSVPRNLRDNCRYMRAMQTAGECSGQKLVNSIAERLTSVQRVPPSPYY